MGTLDFYPSISEELKEEGSMYKDKGYSFYFESDDLANVDTSFINTIKENWKIDLAFITAPELHFERTIEARAAAKNIRQAIANISFLTLEQIAESINGESIQINLGNIKHDSKIDGTLIMTLNITITINQ